MNSKYLTTPIFYVNDKPHMGHAYTTVLTEVLSLYFKYFGNETFFLTGTDEHGQKVQQAALKNKIRAKEHVDKLSKRFQDTWEELSVKPDMFIRTTDREHIAYVQKQLQTLFDKGLIYEDVYEGWYCESDETFLTEKDVIDGKTVTGKTVEKISEKSYFLKTSSFQQKIIDHINENPDFLRPESRKNEILGYLKSDLRDTCISRPKTRLKWGVELPFDSEHVCYVWVDALMNYISALDRNNGDFEKLWQNSIHIMGKDIVTLHTTIWPAILMALDIPLPKSIIAHGWLLNKSGEKMSKSKGDVMDPLELKEIIGVDSLRYYLIRGIKLGSDAEFSREIVAERINTELSNNYGNLVNRTLNLCIKYFDSKVPEATPSLKSSTDLINLSISTVKEFKDSMQNFQPQEAVGKVIELLSETNRYIDKLKPWALAKEDLEKTAECLFTILEVIRVSTLILKPIMPEKCIKVFDCFKQDLNLDNYDQILNIENKLKAGSSLSKPPVIFPKIEL